MGVGWGKMKMDEITGRLTMEINGVAVVETETVVAMTPSKPTPAKGQTWQSKWSRANREVLSVSKTGKTVTLGGILWFTNDLRTKTLHRDFTLVSKSE